MELSEQYTGASAWRSCFRAAKFAGIKIYTQEIGGVSYVCEKCIKTGETRSRPFVKNVSILSQHDYSRFKN